MAGIDGVKSTLGIVVANFLEKGFIKEGFGDAVAMDCGSFI
jgi:hypothetical protein